MAEPAILSEQDPRIAGLAVSLRAVTKVFDNGVMALGPLDLDVTKGEFVSLLGPSGCGKSTALRLIAGLNAPTSGNVGVFHRSRELRAGHSIGFVVTERAGMLWSSVGENVRLLVKLSHAPTAEANGRISEAIAQVGFTEFADAYPRELSGGMKMRVSLARALVTDPDILLMDEPFAALDEITRFRLNNDLLSLWRNLRKTVIFVTHSVFESVYLSQRVVVMTSRPGRIAAEIRIDAAELRGEDFRTSAVFAVSRREFRSAWPPSVSGLPGYCAGATPRQYRPSRRRLTAAACALSGSCFPSWCSRPASRCGRWWCASTISRPMCCRGLARYSQHLFRIGRCCRNRF